MSVPPLVPRFPPTALNTYLGEGIKADRQKTNLVLSSAHPSPFAAHKGFFGNGHFNRANTWLEAKYGPQGGVDWASLGAQT